MLALQEHLVVLRASPPREIQKTTYRLIHQGRKQFFLELKIGYIPAKWPLVMPKIHPESFHT